MSVAQGTAAAGRAVLARLARKASRLSNWETLGRFGQPPIDQALVLFPAASVLVRFTGEGPFTAPGSVPVLCFQAGLALLFAGACLHRWRAPHVVRHHADSFAYIRAELEVILLAPAAAATLRMTAGQLARHRPALAGIHPDCVERLERSVALVQERLKDRAPIESAVAAEWLLAFWLFTTRSAPMTRLVVAACYGAGASLLTAASLTLSAALLVRGLGS